MAWTLVGNVKGATGAAGAAGAAGANGVVNPRGNYVAATTYAKGDSVYYTDGKAYVSTRPLNVGLSPGTNWSTAPPASPETPVSSGIFPSRYAIIGTNVYPGGGSLSWRLETLTAGTLAATTTNVQLMDNTGTQLQSAGSTWSTTVTPGVYYVRNSSAADFTLTGTAVANTDHSSWTELAATPDATAMVPVNTQTTSYTLVLADMGKAVEIERLHWFGTHRAA